MKYAVARINGRQFKLSEGEKITTDRIEDINKLSVEILLLVNDGKIKIGTPVVKGVKIKFKDLGDQKGKKVTVQKYRAKSRYRKKIGFRPQQSRFLVEKISSN